MRITLFHTSTSCVTLKMWQHLTTITLPRGGAAVVSARAFLPLYNLRLPSFGPSQSRLPFITHEQDVEIFDIRIPVGSPAKISILCFSRKRKCNKAKKDKSYEVHWRWRYQGKGEKSQAGLPLFLFPLLGPSSYSSHAMDVCQFHSGAQGRGKLGEKWKYPRGGVGPAVRGTQRRGGGRQTLFYA